MKLDGTPITFLARLARMGNIPHALLFTGQDEAHAKETACKFAQWLFHTDAERESKGADFLDFWQSECSCAACAQVAQLCHPDFCLFDTEQLTIGEVRDIIAKFSLAPFVASRKIAVIAHADQMSDVTANALLKILEEPRGNAFFILIASARSSLLPTIVSRTLEVRFVAEREVLLARYFEKRALYERFLEDRRFIPEKKAELCAILDIWLLKLREKIMAANTRDLIFALKQVLGAKKMLITSNVNPELLMEELHIKLLNTQYA